MNTLRVDATQVRGLVSTDLDGTLLDTHARLPMANRALLERLPDANVIRVVATGRSLYSALNAMSDDFPIDYLVFASGAGIMDWRDRSLLQSHALSGELARFACEHLMARDLDFMVHDPVPDNHCFHAYTTGRHNPDFDARIARYADYARPWPDSGVDCAPVSQLLVVEPADAESCFNELVLALPELKIIRTTSPLDGVSRWIEIFPTSVSKALASEWLASCHGLTSDRCLSVGNDYNDIDLLDWAGTSFVVANAPAELRDRYETVASNDDAGFSVAVQRWLDV